MIDLTHIELATEEDQVWKINDWARLFTATTWEELKMIAENDIHMKAAAEEMYIRTADEMIEQRCRARNDYQKQINTHNRTLRELEEAKAELEAKDKELEVLRKRLAELESQHQ